VGDKEVTLVGGASERLLHRMARDAVRPARTDDDAGIDRLDAAVHMHELNAGAVRNGLQLHRCNPPLDRSAERRETGREDPLSLVLWKAAQEVIAAIDAPKCRGAELGHVRAVHSGAANAVSGIEKRRQQADRIQDLEGARLDGCGARLAMRTRLP